MRKDDDSFDGGGVLDSQGNERTTPPVKFSGVGQHSITGRYSLQPTHEDQNDDSAALSQYHEAQFSSVLREIEMARMPVQKALKTVMLGTSAILNPQQAEPGAGPEEIDRLLDRVRDSESRLTRTGPGGTFYLRDLPKFDRGAAMDDEGTVPSYTLGRVKYLFSGKNPAKVGFGVAVSLEDYLAAEIDDYGELDYERRGVFGVKPFFCLPPRAVFAAARNMEEHLIDHGGYGYHLPAFVKLYAEFVAFALQDHPAVLGAHLLARRFPREAKKMVEEHHILVSRLSSSMLHFLGYEPAAGYDDNFKGRRERDNSVLRSCGQRLFDSFAAWRDHCCRTLTQEEFARSYWSIEVEKVSDLREYLSDRVTVPPMG